VAFAAGFFAAAFFTGAFFTGAFARFGAGFFFATARATFRVGRFDEPFFTFGAAPRFVFFLAAITENATRRRGLDHSNSHRHSSRGLAHGAGRWHHVVMPAPTITIWSDYV
jgi:hypothetical protein